MNAPSTEALWHITVLSNFARGYDKYGRRYSKAGIPESAFPDRFFLLRENELAVGIRKATGLLARLALPGNRLLALRTQVPTAALQPHPRNGPGRQIASPSIPLDGVAFIDGDAEGGRLLPVTVEEAVALSLRLLHPA